MTRIAILGCGYTGQTLLERLLEAGHEVVATTTREARRAELEALGAEAVAARLERPDELRAALSGVRRVVHLAPPDREAPVGPQVEALASALPSDLDAFVYGSTTGAFGNPVEPGTWIDERTVSGNLGRWGQVRLDYERALAAAGLPLRVVRIAGIYGPGRTLRRSLERGMTLFEGGPPTSRIHVEDLARLLAAMLEPDAPALAVGCDDAPAPTLEVARYTCALLGREMPEVMSLDEARATLSGPALEMRMNGRCCRSVVRPGLIGDLAYPSYREGVRASLEAEGALPSADG